MVDFGKVATSAVTAIVLGIGVAAFATAKDGTLVGWMGGIPKSEVAKAAKQLGLEETASFSDIVAALSKPSSTPTGNFVPSAGPHPETKAIVAYYSEKGEKTCPEGWSPFEAAKDRFILGAGGKHPVVGDTGGEEEVTLTEAEMPAHGHSVLWTNGDSISLNRGTNAYRLPFTRDGSVGNNMITDSSGGGRAHNNMPPWIALYFCRKD